MLISMLIMFFGMTAMADDFPSVNTSALSEYDKNAPIGFGASATTGSEDENPVTVTTLAELQNALSGTDKKSIYVSGTITFTGSVSINGVSNKTIYGLPNSALSNTTLDTSDKTKSGILYLKNCSNIIMRNLTFLGAGAYDYDGNDNLTLDGCTNVWVDHCDFQDGVDGNFDCKGGSDNICVSWCRFRYLKAPTSGGSGGSNDHRFSNLWGSGDSATGDDGKLNTTFYACWWDNGCKQRMPRIRYGQVHILNCYYSSSAADYGIGAGYRSNIYVENSAFTISNAWQNYATEGSYTDYNIKLVGNQGADNAESHLGSNTQFVPSYDYTPMPADNVANEVSSHAGATLTYAPAVTETTVYKWESGSETGGTAISYSDGGTTTTTDDITTSYIRLSGKNDFSTFFVTITFDKPLHAGDKIYVTAYRNKNATGKTSGFKAKFEKGSTTVGSSTGTEFVNTNSAVSTSDEYSATPNTCTFIVPDDADGSTTMTMTRSHQGTNLFISKLEITSTVTEEPEPTVAEFKNFSAIVNNQTGTLLTSEEQVEGTAVSFGIAVDDNGNVSRVAVDDASSIATISGTYHSDHGMTGMSVVVPVPGKVTIQIGKCTYSASTITVKNSSNETVLSYTPTDADKVCWKNDHSNIIELLYEGEATTLTISGMGYCPFIAVKEYVEPAEFKDFSAIVNNQTGTLLTSEEQVQGTAVSFGIAVAANGTVSRVAPDDASSIATISGKYHNDHGMTSLKVVVPVPGKVLIQIGKCTYSTSTITVKNSDNETVLSYTPTEEDKQCWKDDHSRIIELKYNGPATTLTITGMGYCPFVAVKKVKTALEKSLYSTDFSEWSPFGANTSTAVVVNKVTNFTEENFTISSFNTALTAVTDTKFQDYTELPHQALQAAKAANPYVTISALANITKVRFIHGATGSNRGWKLEAKGDGDTDWVTISDSPANPAAWQEVTKDINRNNCQLRFTNLTSNQNAYMFELEIFGEVELTMYEITGTISGGNIDGSTITLTGNGETFTADIVDGAFSMSVPAGTYTISLSDDVPFLLTSPTEVEVTAAGSIGTINIEAATAQTVSGAITNAPAEAFTLTFTGNGHTETLECAAGATSFSKDLMPDTYVISTNVGTLSTLSQESFKIVKTAVTHNIYFPEDASPAATEQTIIVDNTITTETANNYKSVTNALAAAKAGNIAAPIIKLTSGQTYREQVVIDQANVTFTTTGTGKAKITFYYGIGYCYYSLSASGVYDKDRAMTRNSIKKIDPVRWGATVLLRGSASGFKAENITFENSFNQYYTDEEVIDGVMPNGCQSITYDRTLGPNDSGYKAADSKAVTERAAAIAFENNPSGCELHNCEFIGSQDTFYSSGSIYVKNCNIVGNTDYIFGGGEVVFDNCDLTIGGYSDQSATAYITANSPSATEAYIFRDCTVKSGGRTHVSANLGRDWGGSKANVYYFNLKNEIGNKLSYKWTNMGGGVAAGTANLHIYDFDPTVNANYSTTGSTGANINGLVSDADALSLYAGVVNRLGFTPEHIYDDNVVLDEASYYNVYRIAATDNVERTVELTRSIGADKWNTIVLPFNLTEAQVKAAFGNDVKVAALTSGTSDKLSFSTVTEMVANQPYAIKVADAFSSATLEGVTVKYSEAPTQTVGDWQFVGTYTKGNVPTDSYFFSSNTLYQAEDETNTITAFRAWFTYNGANASRNLSFTIDDETTSISEELRVKGEESDGVIYDLQGRRVRSAEANSSLFTIHSSLKPGVYIVNGKCVIIK